MNAELRRERIVAAASEQLRGLLESRYVDILEACTRTFQDDGEAPDPVCKVTASIEWDALAPTAKVAVRLAWSAKYKDESETEVDIEQTALDLEGGAQ